MGVDITLALVPLAGRSFRNSEFGLRYLFVELSENLLEKLFFLLRTGY
jgi:hypothetical protein